MSKRIYILNACPHESVFGSDLAESYAKGAKTAGHEVRLVQLRDLSFDPILHYGYHQIQELEPDLLEQQEHLRWCHHWVIVTPVWWESVPAQLKGFFDRILLPGFSFKMHTNSLIPGWNKLLTGRSARIVYTQTIPQWYALIFRRDAFFQGLKQGVLGFVGFHPIRRTVFDVRQKDARQKEEYLRQVKVLGSQGL